MRWISMKSRLLGRPLASSEADHQLLPKTLALPVFASDPLSSVAYATEEAMLVLALAGVGAFVYLTPVSFAVAGLLAIVVISYRQTIRAYPEGGGAFSGQLREPRGHPRGGGGRLAAHRLRPHRGGVGVGRGRRHHLGVARVARPGGCRLLWGSSLLVTVANLRGVKEASTLFAAPTYLFIATVFTMLSSGSSAAPTVCAPKRSRPGLELEAEVGAVDPLPAAARLRLRVDGAHRRRGGGERRPGVPQTEGEERRRHPRVMGAISIVMFLGDLALARLFDVRVSEGTIDTYGTVLSQIGRSAFNGGIGFWVLQVATAAILILAANTAYQDFPRLSAILANHRMMPRQYRNRGDRLVFSNGVVTLALAPGCSSPSSTPR